MVGGRRSVCLSVFPHMPASHRASMGSTASEEAEAGGRQLRATGRSGQGTPQHPQPGNGTRSTLLWLHPATGLHNGQLHVRGESAEQWQGANEGGSTPKQSPGAEGCWGGQVGAGAQLGPAQKREAPTAGPPPHKHRAAPIPCSDF